MNEKRIFQLQEGESAWAVPWAAQRDQYGNYWLNTNFHIDYEGGGTLTMRVSKHQGYRLDIRYCHEEKIPRYDLIRRNSPWLVSVAGINSWPLHVRRETEPKLTVVCWTGPNGSFGHGQPIEAKSAQDWVTSMNKQYPNMNHFTMSEREARYWAEALRSSDHRLRVQIADLVEEMHDYVHDSLAEPGFWPIYDEMADRLVALIKERDKRIKEAR